MGRYKDKHGITRLQALIRRAKDVGDKLPPEVVELAGVVSPRLGSLLKAYQALVSSDDVSPTLKQDLLDLLEASIEDMEQITERHSTDSNGDNWASKNIRPYTLFFLLKFNAFLAIGHLFGFTSDIPEQIWEQWAVAMTVGLGFYFGGREIWKIAAHYKTSRR